MSCACGDPTDIQVNHSRLGCELRPVPAIKPIDKFAALLAEVVEAAETRGYERRANEVQPGHQGAIERRDRVIRELREQVARLESKIKQIYEMAGA